MFRLVAKTNISRTFFKKPNENEALESYVELAKEWENLELPTYAGLSWNAAAKCENALGNSVGEITNLLRSARMYGKNETNDLQSGCVSLGWDTLQVIFKGIKLFRLTSLISRLL